MTPLSKTLQDLRDAFSGAGWVLPAQFVTEGNQDEQEHRLQVLATLTALAKTNQPELALDASLSAEAVYTALDATYGLEKNGIYTLEEAIQLYEGAWGDALQAARLGDLLPGPEELLLSAEQLEVDLSSFDGTLAESQEPALRGLLQAASARGPKRYPWRIGSPRRRHEAEGEIGKPPPSLLD